MMQIYDSLQILKILKLISGLINKYPVVYTNSDSLIKFTLVV